MLKALKALFVALRAGEQLADSKNWKNRQNTINALVALLGAALAILPMVGVRIDLSSEDIAAIAGGIAAVLGLLNVGATTATTDKVGLPTKRDDGGGSGKNDEDWQDFTE